MFIPPMLASPMPKPAAKKQFTLEPGKWAAEEKYDGIRLLTRITASQRNNLFVKKGITPWSRYGNAHPLPGHIMEELAELPDCYIDGELMAPGLRSYGTLAHINRPDLVYYIFDILEFDGIDVTPLAYKDRRNVLLDLQTKGFFKDKVRISFSKVVHAWDQIYTFRDEVWDRDGEGLILKRIEDPYVMKRSKSWMKIKKCHSALFTITGFIPSRGEKNDRGPFAIVELIDDEGITTTVKTKNDAQCRQFEEEAKIPGIHPSIGRKLWCEFQERTPDDEYREIRWDRWDETPTK